MGTGLQTELEFLATGREASLFSQALHSSESAVSAMFGEKVVFIAGAAGSIGRATVNEVLRTNPRRLLLIDQSENGLAEIVRDIRSSAIVPDGLDLRTVCCDITSPLVHELPAVFGEPDVVLNLAASKHVRSERDGVSAARMLAVNVLGTLRLMRLGQASDRFRFFSVSTDKAASPVSLMGASKRLMERVMMEADSQVGATSCRFANVAFSSGSLPESWMRRIGSGQPVAVPIGIRRYFVSSTEAGQFCLLSTTGLANSVFVPDLDPESQLIDLKTLLERVLERVGLTPEYFDADRDALEANPALRLENRQAVVLTNPDTAGEKPYEEFVSSDETVLASGMPNIGRIDCVPGTGSGEIRDALAAIEAVAIGHRSASIDDLVGTVQQAVPTYNPIRSDVSLDERL